LAEPACVKKADNQEELKTLPSVELLLLPVHEPPQLDPEFVNEKVQKAYSNSENCSLVDRTTQHIALDELNGRLIQLSPRPLRDRIVYTIRWHPEEGVNKLTGGAGYLAAKALMPDQDDNQSQKTKWNNLFRDRIVIIGGSNLASRDTHYTPYGSMPGAVVLINAIESLRTHHQIREQSELVGKGIGILVGMAVWLFLEVLRVEMGLVVCVIGYFIAVVFSALLLNVGVWFGVSGVAAGLSAHLLVKLAWPVVRDIRRDGLRALLAKES
jgi:hypothetical protein